MKHRTRFLPAVLPALLCACEPEPQDQEPEPSEPADVSRSTRVQSGPAPTPASPEGVAASEHRPKHVMPEAKAGFDRMRELLAEHYVDGPLSEDEFWTAASEGVLARLIQLPDHPVNQLLHPADLADLKAGIAGKLSGIGVHISKVAEVILVQYVIPGSPAEQAGIRAGDRILAVDGKRAGPLVLGDIVAAIRGQTGTTLELFLQRDTEEWTVGLQRGEIKMPGVQAKMLGPKVGLVTLNYSLGEHTHDELLARLAELERTGMTALVLDLRGCPGGLFDAALSVAREFLPAGADVVRIEDRRGKSILHRAEQNGAHHGLPLAVLVDHETASGAELIAAALQARGRATLLGSPTMGKTTVEAIHTLDNGWALKLSSQRFFAAGLAQPGPVTPDLRLAGPADPPDFAELTPDTDPVVAAALHLLQRP